MGNTYCTGAREQYAEKKKASAEKYQEMKTKIKERSDKAKDQAKDKYSVAKLLAKGYSFNNYNDNGETKQITTFESNLSICKVALDDYEKRLKDFMEERKTTRITVPQLCEIFKDQFYLKEIDDENSMTRKLFTHRAIMSPEGEANINYLMLLGILLCASTKGMKAQSFYNILKREQINQIPKNDILLPELVQKLMEISYSMMIKLHAGECKGQEKNLWILDNIDQFYKDIYNEEFIPRVFGSEEKLVDEVFIFKLNKECTEFLKSYELRKIIFSRVVDHIFKNASAK